MSRIVSISNFGIKYTSHKGRNAIKKEAKSCNMRTTFSRLSICMEKIQLK